MSMVAKKRVSFGGMRIFPNADLARILGVKEQRIGNEIIAVPDTRLTKRFESEGLDPAQMTKHLWIYVKGNKLLRGKSKPKITMPTEHNPRGLKGKTKKPRARSRKDS